MAGAALKVFAAAGSIGRASGTRGFGLLSFQVGEIGLAVTAADRVQVKVNVGRFFALEDAQEIAAELLARGTR